MSTKAILPKKRTKKVQQAIRSPKVCSSCGSSISFWDKLNGAAKHGLCSDCMSGVIIIVTQDPSDD